VTQAADTSPEEVVSCTAFMDGKDKRMDKITISTGLSRFEKRWKTQHLTADELCERLSSTIRTPETVADYAALPKGQRDNIKDRGGFVGGKLRGSRRLASAMESRSLITLDLDDCPAGYLSTLAERLGYDCFVYTTHSHTPEAPRYRVLVFLTRDVSADEYNAIAHYLAHDLGSEHVDPCSFRVAQLMYWPTTSVDGEFFARRFAGDPLNPDQFLLKHPNWHDLSDLPVSERETVAMGAERRSVEDPHDKRGIVGLFCRTYADIEDAIEKYLKHVYQPSAMHPGRYDFLAGSSTAGAAVIDGKWLYSHHATDPAGGHMQNAFDLIRIHLFGDKDKNYVGTPDGAPSYRAMVKLAEEDALVRAQSRKERVDSLHEDFGTPEDPADMSWEDRLIYTRHGGLAADIVNAVLILENHPALKSIVFNDFADNLEIGDTVPWEHTKYWRDVDDAQLDYFISSNYGPLPSRITKSGVDKVAHDRHYHPIRNFLAALPEWDGKVRAETFFIDFFSAPDTEYTRTVTRKTLVAAVRRVLQPGCKFDYVLTLVGPQGLGKSTAIRKLCGDAYFTDNVSITDTTNKTAAENLQGNWIVEIPEMAGLRKTDVETVKAFITRQNDKYRASYGRRTEEHPRQCIFFGSANEESGFLRDNTGNRRFWPILTPKKGPMRLNDLTQDYILQVWAEAKHYEAEGEPIYLTDEMEEEASRQQVAVMELDERQGLIQNYLDTLLPENWDQMDIYARQEYLRGDDPTRARGTVRRTSVSNMEIWVECYGKRKEDLTPRDSYQLSAMMMRFPEWKKSRNPRKQRLYGRQRVYERQPGEAEPIHTLTE